MKWWGMCFFFGCCCCFCLQIRWVPFSRTMVSERRVVCWRDVLKLMYTPGLPEVGSVRTKSLSWVAMDELQMFFFHHFMIFRKNAWNSFLLAERIMICSWGVLRHSLPKNLPTDFLPISAWHFEGKKLILRPRLFELVAGPEEVPSSDPALSTEHVVDACQVSPPWNEKDIIFVKKETV